MDLRELLFPLSRSGSRFNNRHLCLSACSCAALVLHLCSIPAQASSDPAAELQVGRWVEVRPSGEPGRIQADQITIDSGVTVADRAAEEIVLRGQIEFVDEDASEIGILGQRIVVNARTRVPSTIAQVGDLRQGQWVKVTARAQADGSWQAERIRTDESHERAKIEGLIADRWPQSGRPDSISLSNLVILVYGNTRINDHRLANSERLFRDMLEPRDPDDPAPWLARTHYWSRGKAGVIQRFENEYTIGDSASDHYREAEPFLKMEFAALGPAGLSAFLKLRARAESVLNDAPLRHRNREPVITLYEGFALWRDIAALPIALQVGRQDFEDNREWLFDDQLDAVRWYAYPLYPVTAEFAYVNSLDDSQDNKFRTNHDYLILVHGSVLGSDEVSLYRFWRTDHGTRGREPVWTGLHYHGNGSLFSPWLDAAWLRGWDKGRRFRANAIDLGATITIPVRAIEWSLTAGYAHGSGNTQNPKVTGINEQFEQTGYEDNTGQFNGVTSFQYYGEVFDPELANLDILTLGFGVRPRENISIDMIFHRYQQAEYSEDVRRELVATDLTVFDLGGRGIDPANGRPVADLFPYRDVGTGVDAVLGINRVFGVLDIKYVLGFFSPGDALSPPFWSELPFKPEKRTAVLSRLGAEWRF